MSAPKRKRGKKKPWSPTGKTPFGTRGPLPLSGDRYPGGKLKPPKPNDRVVAMRRELLGGAADAPVDITKAENPLDLALARGWLTEARHRAAQRFAALFRRSMGALPELRTMPAASDNLSWAQQQAAALEALDDPAAAPSGSGVLTEEDRELLEVLRSEDLTERERTYALKRHRSRRIDWSRVPDADIAAVFYSALGVGEHERQIADPARDDGKLRELWNAMTTAQARELTEVAVLGLWPRWTTLRIFSRPVPRQDEAKRIALDDALDVVIDKLGVHIHRVHRFERLMETTASDPVQLQVRAARGQEDRPEDEHLRYVDREGRPLFEVVRRRIGRRR